MQAIEQYKRLIKLRPDPTFWDQNIIEAHALCKNEKDHKLFYLFLCSPQGSFDPAMVDKVKTLGERMDQEDFKSGIEELPDELTQDVYKNGNVYTIRTRRKDRPMTRVPPQPPSPTSSDDEKAEPVPIDGFRMLEV